VAAWFDVDGETDFDENHCWTGQSGPISYVEIAPKPLGAMVEQDLSA
jgi:hypothetical protein